MNDKFQDTLSDLANGLGISVNQLWDWLQGQGINAYSTVVINQLIFTVSVTFILFCICCILDYKFYKGYLSEKTERFGDSDLPFFGILFSSVIGIFMLIMFLGSSYDLVGWLSSPEGMIIQLFLNKF